MIVIRWTYEDTQLGDRWNKPPGGGWDYPECTFIQDRWSKYVQKTKTKAILRLSMLYIKRHNYAEEFNWCSTLT